jgi:lysine 6-dehydrogenase
MKVIILGAGLVGSPMAFDLARNKNFEVHVADMDRAALSKIEEVLPVTVTCDDFTIKDNLKRLIEPYDLVLSAVPGWMGFDVLKTIIESGKNAVDIAFFPEDPGLLDKLAKDKGVTVVTDCGVAPGMSNILTLYSEYQLDSVKSSVTWVGGLPKEPDNFWEYRAVFSPADVIEEYVRPARMKINGEQVIREPLTDIEPIEFEGFDNLECFNSDGARTLLKNSKADTVVEKTVRYRGYAEKISVLKESGFFGNDPILVSGKKISPLEFTTAMLFPQWQQKPGDRDVTLMRVEVEGLLNDRRRMFRWELIDHYDEKSGVHSMARTTGYTATVVLNLLAEGRIKEKGVLAPELLGKDEQLVRDILDGLAERGVKYELNEIFA